MREYQERSNMEIFPLAGSLAMYLSISLGLSIVSGTKCVYVMPRGSNRFMNSLMTRPMTLPLRPSKMTSTCFSPSTMRLCRSVSDSASSSEIVAAMHCPSTAKIK